jgi:ribosomal protein S18 acetylase RimI-like enzyme
MSDITPINLLAVPIALDSPEFTAICDWPFQDDYVRRVLRDDVRWRVHRGTGRVWIYLNPEGELAGFGTIDECRDYGDYTEGQLHPYIPLLAVNPAMQGRGYGRYIVRHLVDLAAILASGPGGCRDILFLDVYTDNTVAIRLYEKCGFRVIEPEPRSDPDEGGRPYFIMAMRVSVMPASEEG